MAELLDDGRGGKFTSWADALADWPLDARIATDASWFKTRTGELQHPYLQNKLDWFSGEDRAARMSRAREEERREREALSMAGANPEERARNRATERAEAAKARSVEDFMYKLVYETSEANANKARRTRDRQRSDQAPIDEVLASVANDGGGVSSTSSVSAGALQRTMTDCDEIISEEWSIPQLKKDANRLNQAAKMDDDIASDVARITRARSGAAGIVDRVIDVDELSARRPIMHPSVVAWRVVVGSSDATYTSPRTGVPLTYEIIANAEMNCKQAIRYGYTLGSTFNWSRSSVNIFALLLLVMFSHSLFSVRSLAFLP